MDSSFIGRSLYVFLFVLNEQNKRPFLYNILGGSMQHETPNLYIFITFLQKFYVKSFLRTYFIDVIGCLIFFNIK